MRVVPILEDSILQYGYNICGIGEPEEDGYS